MKNISISLLLAFIFLSFTALGQTKMTSREAKDIRTQARQKIAQFQRHVLIVNGKSDEERTEAVREKEIPKAKRLFVGGATVESAGLSNKNGKKLSVEAYLKKVLEYQSKYSFVKLKFYHISLSEPYKEPNGNYKMIGTIRQQFTRYRVIDGKKIPVYSDFTIKSVEIIIKKIKAGKYEYYYLRLGDISVDDVLTTNPQTKASK